MKRTLLTYRHPLFIVSALLALFVITLKPVFIRSGGRSIRIFTHAVTVSMALQDAGIWLTAGDRTEPAPSEMVGWGSVIEVRVGRMVAVAQGETVRWASYSGEETVTVSEILRRAGVRIAGDEIILGDGRELAPDAVAPRAIVRIDLVRPRTVRVAVDGKESDYTVAGPTVGEALYQAGVRRHAADAVEPAPDSLLADIDGSPARIAVTRARELTVLADGAETRVLAAGATVGEALAQAGFALAGLDYAKPADADPLPADGVIRIVRVREETLREQSPIPFEEDMQPVDDLEIDHTKIVSTGIFGIQESAVRIRYEDGVEVSRTPLGSRMLVPPQNYVYGYGTKIVTRAFTGAGGPFQYWRAVNVFATSYSPCRSAGEAGRCYPHTATGKDVRKGVIAVVRRWFNYMRGQPVYVVGYGYATIEDIGAGKKGMYWIDLGYTDEEYEIGPRASGWTTVYFLEPVPASILWIL